LNSRNFQDQRSEKYESKLKSANKVHSTSRGYKKELRSSYKSGNYNLVQKISAIKLNLLTGTAPTFSLLFFNSVVVLLGSFFNKMEKATIANTP
jgi:hypothetical protein